MCPDPSTLLSVSLLTLPHLKLPHSPPLLLLRPTSPTLMLNSRGDTTRFDVCPAVLGLPPVTWSLARLCCGVQTPTSLSTSKCSPTSLAALAPPVGNVSCAWMKYRKHTRHDNTRWKRIEGYWLRNDSAIIVLNQVGEDGNLATG